MKYTGKTIAALLLVLVTLLGCFSGMNVSAQTEAKASGSAELRIVLYETSSDDSGAPQVLAAAEGDNSSSQEQKAVGGTVTSLDVYSGNSVKNKVSCLGGSFKLVVKGTDIYNKIAVFRDGERIGNPVLAGKEGSKSTSVTIEKGKFILPSNNSNAEIDYELRVYPGSMNNTEITAKNGKKMATVIVESRRDAFEITPSSLEYSAKGGSLDININTNCPLNAIVADSSWITMKQPAGQMKLVVTAQPNSGAERSTKITFSTTGSSKESFTVKLTQEGLDCVYRLRGSNRVTTSTAISYYGWDKASSVILANGVNFADALAGAPLSAALDAPILLTMNKKDGAEGELLDEIKRLGAKKVYILGGNSAVSADIEKDIKEKGCTVDRIAGKSRYGTAVAIAEKLSDVTGKKFEKLYFTNAANYPDALSISAIAAMEGNPILYMPAKGKIESTTKEFVSAGKFKNGVVLGGTGAVSAEGYTSLEKLGLTMSRISGKDRYKTSVAINEKYASLFTGKEVAIATGTNFPDALAGSALCAKLKMPVVLASEKSYKDAYDYLRSDKFDQCTLALIFGGTGAVSHKLAVNLLYSDNGSIY